MLHTDQASILAVNAIPWQRHWLIWLWGIVIALHCWEPGASTYRINTKIVVDNGVGVHMAIGRIRQCNNANLAACWQI
jgi:hypothetical protein